MQRARLAWALLACMAFPPGPLALAAEIKAVASFSILGDMVSRVGGSRVEVATLVGPDGDAHVYQPKPADAKAMAAAQVVFVNGLGFEGWLERLAAASGYQGKPVVVTDGIAPEPRAASHQHEEAGAHAQDSIDPHAWQDAANAQVYVRNIAEGLCAADAAGCAAYRANAAAYGREIAALDAEIEAAIARVPADKRTVITTHDSFGYFARAYGIAFLAPEGVSTESEASAWDVARLIEQIRARKASALFVENVSDPRLVEQIARETGLKLGGALYSDALSPEDGPAPTYLAMMRHNLRLLSTAMTGS